MVKYLVSQGADVNKYGYDSDPLLVVAVREGNYDFIFFLLSSGAIVCNLSFVLACSYSLEVTSLFLIISLLYNY